MSRVRVRLLPVLVLTALSINLAVDGASPVDVYHFDTPEQEARYRRLTAEIRCPKCMNTNIAGSDALSAQTLRAAVHRLIVEEGRTDQEILDFMQDRYGDFVLYDPPLSSRTWLVWLLPVLVGIVIFAFISRVVLRARSAEAPQLDLDRVDDETRKRLEGLIDRQ